MGYETILVSAANNVAVLTLNRPDVLNAMNNQLVTELDRAITEAEEDDEIRAIIITGSGERAFSAGGDIHEQRRVAGELSPEEEQRANKTNPFSQSPRNGLPFIRGKLILDFHCGVWFRQTQIGITCCDVIPQSEITTQSAKRHVRVHLNGTRQKFIVERTSQLLETGTGRFCGAIRL